jgi:hypothetical protein
MPAAIVGVYLQASGQFSDVAAQFDNNLKQVILRNELQRLGSNFQLSVVDTIRRAVRENPDIADVREIVIDILTNINIPALGVDNIVQQGNNQFEVKTNRKIVVQGDFIKNDMIQLINNTLGNMENALINPELHENMSFTGENFVGAVQKQILPGKWQDAVAQAPVANNQPQGNIPLQGGRRRRASKKARKSMKKRRISKKTRKASKKRRA